MLIFLRIMTPSKVRLIFLKSRECEILINTGLHLQHREKPQPVLNCSQETQFFRTTFYTEVTDTILFLVIVLVLIVTKEKGLS